MMQQARQTQAKQAHSAQFKKIPPRKRRVH
jgi:hypothetical protein